MRPIIALDLGTRTGVSMRHPDGAITGATWVLAKEKALREARAVGEDRSGDIRVVALDLLLDDAMRLSAVRQQGETLVVFEDVQFLSSQMQSQLWASFRTVLWLAAHRHGFEVLPVPVGTLKKFATGHGNATKDMMAAALAKKGELLPAMDDNEVDARWLRRFAEAALNKAEAGRQHLTPRK